MRDEVNQAAERLRKGSYSLHDEDEYFMSSRKFEDMGILADAYLDEHDDEHDPENALPLSAEILQASGWEPLTSSSFYIREHNIELSRGVRLADGATVWAVMNATSSRSAVGSIETVGDLRKLLEALHIDAVVVVPNGGE